MARTSQAPDRQKLVFILGMFTLHGACLRSEPFGYFAHLEQCEPGVAHCTNALSSGVRKLFLSLRRVYIRDKGVYMREGVC